MKNFVKYPPYKFDIYHNDNSSFGQPIVNVYDVLATNDGFCIVTNDGFEIVAGVKNG